MQGFFHAGGMREGVERGKAACGSGGLNKSILVRRKRDNDATL